MPVIPESILRNETQSVPPGYKSADGGRNGGRKQTHQKKKYSQAVKDGFAEQRSGDDREESSEEEGMIGGWSNEEVEGVIDVDVATNEEREHQTEHGVITFWRSQWWTQLTRWTGAATTAVMMKMMSVLILRECQ